MLRLKPALLAALALLALLLIGLGIWWFLLRPGRQQDKAAGAQAEATIAAAAPRIARDTLKEVDRYHEKTTEIRTITAAGNAAIAAADGAAHPMAPAVAAAGRAALCMHKIYRAHPGCAGLLELRAPQPDSADVGRAASGR